MDVNRIIELFYGKEGDVMPGCCGERERLVEEPSADECTFLSENIMNILYEHDCLGTQTEEFIQQNCKCHYFNEATKIGNGCARHAKWKITRYYLWGYLFDTYAIHDKTLSAILSGIDYTKHHIQYHLFKCFESWSASTKAYELLWNAMKEHMPHAFASYQCCPAKCNRNTNRSYKTIFTHMYFTERLELFERYVIDYINLRHSLGTTEPFEVYTPDCTDLNISGKKVGETPLNTAALKLSVKCVKLFHKDNPDFLEYYIHEYCGGLENLKPMLLPIIHSVLYRFCCVTVPEKQEQVAELLRTLIHLGADLYAETICDDCTIPLGNLLAVYKYDYPDSPVIKVFEPYNIKYSNNSCVNKWMEEVTSAFTSSEPNPTAYNIAYNYGLIKDPAKFHSIALEVLGQYRQDYIKAGRFPYNSIGAGLMFPEGEYLFDCIEKHIHPDEIDLSIFSK